jgi:raffinose/stachyose/melibiose transport system permease protein
VASADLPEATAFVSGVLMVASAVSTLTTRRSSYPGWFYLPAAVIYGVLFLLPTFASFYFSLTRWSLFSSSFIGFENFIQFFREPFLIQGLVNTIIYAVITSGLKVVIGMLLAVMLTSQIMARGLLRSLVFFPVLVSTIGVGITFTVLMHPTQGAINEGLALLGIKGPGWLTDPKLALFSVALVDVWKGVGLATVIYIAGIVAIPKDYYEAARIDGGTKLQNFFYITLPLSRPATATVITLSFIGGLRTFDLIWAMTKGGPGFASDTIASVIYKQYQSGFFGLSTAGNVVLFILIAILVVPITIFLNRREGHQ